jgi:hypothetical protein
MSLSLLLEAEEVAHDLEHQVLVGLDSGWRSQSLVLPSMLVKRYQIYPSAGHVPAQPSCTLRGSP